MGLARVTLVLTAIDQIIERGSSNLPGLHDLPIISVFNLLDF